MDENRRLELESLINKMKDTFISGRTFSYKMRMFYLSKLHEVITKKMDKILDALKKDLSKSYKESYLTEVTPVLSELKYFKKNLKRLMRPKRIKGNLETFPSKSKVIFSPLGLTYIISPFNYPFQLTFIPLIDAIASGNVVILKTSDKSKNTSVIIDEIMTEVFNEKDDDHNQIAVYLEDLTYEESDYIMEHPKIDHIFFTGSIPVGRKIYKAASKNLARVTLELGGKSPCVVDKDTYSLTEICKRIAFGKYTNAGQTCIGVDTVFLHKEIEENFYSTMKEIIDKFYTTSPLENENYGKIIDQRAFDRLVSYLDQGEVVTGGHYDSSKLKIEPTILKIRTEDVKSYLDSTGSDNNDYDDNTKVLPILKEEIFGPILSVITYSSYDELLSLLQKCSNESSPLAFYIFSKNKKLVSTLLNSINFGGGCVNDTLMHITNNNLPFGGLKQSGTGSYHGKHGFINFSHTKSVVTSSSKVLDLRFPPYTDDIGIIKKLFK